jgi:hypothetical protein
MRRIIIVTLSVALLTTTAWVVRGVAARRVSTFLRQTRRRNHCVVVGSSFGWLIHTIVGSAGGSGGLRTKRSRCSA